MMEPCVETGEQPQPVEAGATDDKTQRQAMYAWASSYAGATMLKKSVKAMIVGKRRHAISIERDESELLLQSLADAIERKAKDEIVEMVLSHPQLLRMTVENDRLPLHLICALSPNYYFVDVLEMMIKAFEESPGCMDQMGQTPLHVLCMNPSVTCQALAILTASLPACVAMSDKEANLPLHYLCRNKACELDMIRQIGSDDLYSITNHKKQTPLHCLAMTAPLKNEAFLYTLICCPEAAFVSDKEGRNILHWVCEAPELDLAVLDQVLKVARSTAKVKDQNQDLPIAILCQNKSISIDMMKLALQAFPESITDQAKDGMTPLHFICANESVTPDLLTEFFFFDRQNNTCSLVDSFGATPMHLLCMNESITSAHVAAMLHMCSDTSFNQDQHGRSPLHYLCMNSSVSPELLWQFFVRDHELARQVDKDGRTPLHYTCSLRSITATLLEILFDAFPAATMVVDEELKLPVQYLADNPSTSAEITALLISGPTSYRLRYDFLSTGSQCVTYMRNSDIVHQQTNVAADASTSTKVFMKFLSSQDALDYELDMIESLSAAHSKWSVSDQTFKDYSCEIHEVFDDAKKRVAMRNNVAVPEDQHSAGYSDTTVTLNYALITQAPEFNLERFSNEMKTDGETIKRIIVEITNCLVFWHLQAHMVHGNISLENVGHFKNRGLCLYDFSTSRKLQQEVTCGIGAFQSSSCSPEAAKALLANEKFQPTPQSDVWQFGCLVYFLATGKTLLQQLAPWSEVIGVKQQLHIISALNESVLLHLLENVDPEVRPFLQQSLILNPSHRWRIDRIKASLSANSSSLRAKTSLDRLRYNPLVVENSHLEEVETKRAPKHAQEQLEFIRREQSQLRHNLLAAKTQLHDVEETCEQLRNQIEVLCTQLAESKLKREEAQLEVQVLAHNHQSMTLQLHTTVQMLLNLVPLARKVYGAKADEFLSGALSQAAGAHVGLHSRYNLSFEKRPPHRLNPIEMIKRQLQSSVLAHGCVNTWANSGSSAPLQACCPHTNTDSREGDDHQESSLCSEDATEEETCGVATVA